LHSSVASTLLPGEGDEEKCKEGSRAEPYARPEVFKRGDGRAPGGRKRLARAPGGRKRLAESADFLPNLCVFVVYIYIYIYIYVCICVFSRRGTTSLVVTLSSKSSAHVVASGTQQGAAAQKIAAECCDFEFGGCTSSRTTERRSAGFGGSHPLSSPGLGAPAPYS
jgi:hypothetical protein